MAVNAATGKYLWHFQLVHHDIWDHDLDTPPVLLTVRKNGRNIPAVATMTKSAYLFILDRVTGKPIYDVKEVPVPASTVTDEQAWPTQPMPVKPPPLARQSFSAATDIATVTPEHKAFCEKLIKDKKLHDSVAYSPPHHGFADRAFPRQRRWPGMGRRRDGREARAVHHQHP